MQFLCIDVNESADDIIKNIADELQQLDKKICYSIDEVEAGGLKSIICRLSDSKLGSSALNGEKGNDEIRVGKRFNKQYDTLITHVSNALADYIIGRYEEKIIERVINANYCYFTPTEKKEILNIALRIIKNEDKNFLNSLYQIRRRNIIIRKLLDYFEGSNSIILDGFVNFRLKDYRKDLEEIVDRAVDDFLMEREYREFIRLLRYFVDIQDPRFDTVHVIVDYDNKYTLLDENNKEITNECIQEFINEIAEGDINYDDLLVSSLITLAPRRIIIHSAGQFSNKELLETIKNVFLGKVVICTECEICAVNVAKRE